jgi:hypothetical protein
MEVNQMLDKSSADDPEYGKRFIERCSNDKFYSEQYKKSLNKIIYNNQEKNSENNLELKNDCTYILPIGCIGSSSNFSTNLQK